MSVSILFRTESVLRRISNGMSHISAAAVFGMMMVTCIDVVLRKLRLSVPGAYETVEFLSAIFISFSLALTSLEKGHIAVNFLVQRFSRRVQEMIEVINLTICTVMFVMVTVYMFRYGSDLKSYGEVSMTLQLPVYPFVWGVAFGIGVLTLVLAFQSIAAVSGLFGRGLPEDGDDTGV